MLSEITQLIHSIQYGGTDNQLGMPEYYHTIASRLREIIKYLEEWAAKADANAEEWENAIRGY
jgi:hypothetical protein